MYSWVFWLCCHQWPSSAMRQWQKSLNDWAESWDGSLKMHSRNLPMTSTILIYLTLKWQPHFQLNRLCYSWCLTSLLVPSQPLKWNLYGLCWMLVPRSHEWRLGSAKSSIVKIGEEKPVSGRMRVLSSLWEGEYVKQTFSWESSQGLKSGWTLVRDLDLVLLEGVCFPCICNENGKSQELHILLRVSWGMRREMTKCWRNSSKSK